MDGRRAAVLAYITNQLLRTLPAIAKEESVEPEVIIDMQMRNPGRDKATTESGQPS